MEQRDKEYYEWQMFYHILHETVSFMGNDVIDNARRFSVRVDELPSLPTAALQHHNLSNWYPLNDPVLQRCSSPAPSKLVSCPDVDAWRNLPIGAAIFVCYRGPQNSGRRYLCVLQRTPKQMCVCACVMLIIITSFIFIYIRYHGLRMGDGKLPN